MLWQFKSDFLSLFTRGNNKQNYLDPIDGLRSIASLSIILLHLILAFNSLIPPYPHIRWQQFLMTKAFTFMNMFCFALEIFFITSGFLLTYKLLTQWNKSFPDVKLFLRKQYPISILKRALRFWPGMLLITLISLILGEPYYPNSSRLFEFFRLSSIWLFVQNYINSDYWYVSLSPLWSVSLDMQVYIILPLLLYLFYSYRSRISTYKCLLILLLLSVIQGIMAFNPLMIPMLSLTYRYPSLPMITPAYINNWFKTQYNATFSPDIPNDKSPKLFMDTMYLPLEARFGSFIVGAMLAIKVIESSNHQTKHKTSKRSFFFGLIFFQLLSLMQGPEFSPPPDIVLILAIACTRQIFAIGQAFILFTALCPPTHPYHSPWIRRFLSSSVWIPISKLSYLVYLIHSRLIFEVIYGGPLNFLQTYSVTYAALICLPIILFLSQLISCIWFILVEKPIERLIQNYSNKKQLSKSSIE